jgi:ATP-dependent protease HslVU (ClpYQ) ATPase subunit
MRVVALHQRRRRVRIAEARAEVLRAAGLMKAGVTGPDTEDLVRRLEKVTGVSIAELEQCALGWHDA